MLHGSTNQGHPQITKKSPWERDVRTADDPACLVAVTTRHELVCGPALVLQPAVVRGLLFFVALIHDGASAPVPRGYPPIHEELHRSVSHHLLFYLALRAAVAFHDRVEGLPGFCAVAFALFLTRSRL